MQDFTNINELKDFSSGLTTPTYEYKPQEGPSQEIKDLGSKPVEIGSGEDYISNQALVDTQLGRILSEDNPYIKAARNAAKRAMNRRGLLSSSIAINAAQDAAIKSALPIAQQNAELYGRGDLAKQDYDIRSGLAQQGFLSSLGQAQYQAGLNAGQNIFNYQAGLNDRLANTAAQSYLGGQEFEQQKELSDINFQHSKELEELHGQTQLMLDNAANRFRMELEKLNLDTNSRNNIYDKASALTGNYLNQYNSLLQNPDLTPEARKSFIETLNNEYRTQLDELLKLGAGAISSIAGANQVFNQPVISNPQAPFGQEFIPTNTLNPDEQTKLNDEFKKLSEGITAGNYNYSFTNLGSPGFKVVDQNGKQVSNYVFDTEIIKDEFGQQYAKPKIIIITDNQGQPKQVWPIKDAYGNQVGYVPVV